MTNKILTKAIELASSPHLYLTHFIDSQIHVICSSSSADLWQERGRIRDLFFRILPSYTYDRKAVLPGSSLEYVLDHKLYFSHQKETADPVTDRKIEETVREALFACRLGIKPEKAESDFHEVYYLLDRAGQRLGVFKPRMDKFFLNDAYGASEDREAHLADCANSQLDQQLGTKVVPYTVLLTCNLPLSAKPIRMTGSFQFYVPNPSFLEESLEGNDFFNPDCTALQSKLDTEANRALNLPNFESFVFFDIATANNDRHFRNTLRKTSGELVAIDNSNSFPWCHERDLPFYKMKPLHSFKWRALPQAQIPFSQKVVQQIHQLDLPQIESTLRNELVDKTIPSSKEHIEGKIQTFRDRVKIIQKLSREGASIAEIAEEILKLSTKKSRCPSLTSSISSIWQKWIRPILNSEKVETLLARFS